MSIEDYLNMDEFTSRKELVAKTGLSDRVIRDKIRNLKLRKAILYNSQTKGYRLAKTRERLNQLNISELANEMYLTEHTKRDILSRISKLSEEVDTYNKYLEQVNLVYLERVLKEQNDFLNDVDNCLKRN